MAPRESADTSRPWPNFRLIISELLMRDHRPSIKRLLEGSCGPCRILAEKRCALLTLRACETQWEPFPLSAETPALQPLRARHVLAVSLSSLIIRWMTPTWKVWSEQNLQEL